MTTETVDLSVRIGSLTLANPVMSASGCFGYGVEYADVVDLSTLGAVVVKGLFLAERPVNAPGSAVLCSVEGSRPILVEVQALVSSSSYGTARRMASGIDPQRLVEEDARRDYGEKRWH